MYERLKSGFLKNISVLYKLCHPLSLSFLFFYRNLLYKCSGFCNYHAITFALMIKYTPSSQLVLKDFSHPFDNELSPDNRWLDKISRGVTLG